MNQEETLFLNESCCLGLYWEDWWSLLYNLFQHNDTHFMTLASSKSFKLTRKIINLFHLSQANSSHTIFPRNICI